MEKSVSLKSHQACVKQNTLACSVKTHLAPAQRIRLMRRHPLDFLAKARTSSALCAETTLSLCAQFYSEFEHNRYSLMNIDSRSRAHYKASALSTHFLAIWGRQ